MQCQESKTILGAYLDGEIELMRSVELEEHLAVCAECGRDLEGQRGLQELLRNPSLRYTAPAGLRESIRASLSETKQPETKPEPRPQRTTGSRLGPALQWAAFAPLCVGLAAAKLFWFRGLSRQKLAGQAGKTNISTRIASH